MVWELSSLELEKIRAGILEDVRTAIAAVESGTFAPSPRLGAIWYHDWLECGLPPGVHFPLGVNHWLLEPVFPDDHWLAQGDGPPMTWIDCHNTVKARREARLVEQPPARRHKPMPLCLVRCIHAAYLRVTPERIADWCLALSPFMERYVMAFILAEAPRDPLIREAGSRIATRRAGFPALIDAPSGERRRPPESTRDAYMLAAVSALKGRFGGSIRFNSGERASRSTKPSEREGMARYTSRKDWCAVVAPVFVSNRRPMKARRLREIFGALPEHERERIRWFHQHSARKNSD